MSLDLKDLKDLKVRHMKKVNQISPQRDLGVFSTWIARREWYDPDRDQDPWRPRKKRQVLQKPWIHILNAHSSQDGVGEEELLHAWELEYNACCSSPLPISAVSLWPDLNIPMSHKFQKADIQLWQSDKAVISWLVVSAIREKKVLRCSHKIIERQRSQYHQQRSV